MNTTTHAAAQLRDWSGGGPAAVRRSAAVWCAAPVRRAAAVRRASAVRRAATVLGDESGAATAEYAIATLAAVGFAGLLVVVLRGDDIKGMLTDIIHHALSISI